MTAAEKYVKVVETQDVSAETLEDLINKQIDAGWVLDGIHFAMRDASRRPAMAFLIFFDPQYARKTSSRSVGPVE
jgi:hypothetical protein